MKYHIDIRKRFVGTKTNVVQTNALCAESRFANIAFIASRSAHIVFTSNKSLISVLLFQTLFFPHSGVMCPDFVILSLRTLKML